MNPQQILYSSDYSGPRWRYALLLRPNSIFNLPSKYQANLLIGSGKPHPLYRHGTVDYTGPIDDATCQHFDLLLVEQLPE